MFTCSKCNSEVEELIKGRKDCRLCYNSYMAEYMLKRYHRRRTEWVIKLGSRCVDCGSVVDLEFDHDDKTTKSFDVAKALSGWAEKRLVAEMAKCVCYDVVHAMQKNLLLKNLWNMVVASQERKIAYVQHVDQLKMLTCEVGKLKINTCAVS